MEDTKLFLQESRDTVNELLTASDTNPIERLQYKVMVANLDRMLSVVTWLQNMRQLKKTR